MMSPSCVQGTVEAKPNASTRNCGVCPFFGILNRLPSIKSAVRPHGPTRSTDSMRFARARWCFSVVW